MFLTNLVSLKMHVGKPKKSILKRKKDKRKEEGKKNNTRNGLFLFQLRRHFGPFGTNTSKGYSGSCVSVDNLQFSHVKQYGADVLNTKNLQLKRDRIRSHCDPYY